MNNPCVIYTTAEGTVAVVVPTGEKSIEEVAAKDVPEGATYQIIDGADIPSDRYFRDAWVSGKGKVDIDLDKAKQIGHRIRRAYRAAWFEQYDDIIAKQIPGNDFDAAEASRANIRQVFADIQTAIDAAKTPEEIKDILETNKFQAS